MGDANGIDISGNPNSHSLTPRGWQRSGALGDVFTGSARPGSESLLTPNHLICPNYGDDATTSERRTYETLLGVSGLTGLPILSPYPENDEAQLAAAVIDQYSGVVLICWEHTRIPALAGSISASAPTSIPQTWPKDRYDIIWKFTRDGDNSTTYSFEQLPQRLLGGDLDSIITP